MGSFEQWRLLSSLEEKISRFSGIILDQFLVKFAKFKRIQRINRFKQDFKRFCDAVPNFIFYLKFLRIIRVLLTIFSSEKFSNFKFDPEVWIELQLEVFARLFWRTKDFLTFQPLYFRRIFYSKHNFIRKFLPLKSFTNFLQLISKFKRYEVHWHKTINK